MKRKRNEFSSSRQQTKRVKKNEPADDIPQVSEEPHPTVLRRSARHSGLPTESSTEESSAVNVQKKKRISQGRMTAQEHESMRRAYIDMEDLLGIRNKDHPGIEEERVNTISKDLDETMLEVLEASARNLLLFYSQCSLDELFEFCHDGELSTSKTLSQNLSIFSHIKRIYEPRRQFLCNSDQDTGEATKPRTIFVTNLATALTCLLQKDIDGIKYIQENYSDVFSGLVSDLSSDVAKRLKVLLSIYALSLENQKDKTSKLEYLSRQRSIIGGRENEAFAPEFEVLVGSETSSSKRHINETFLGPALLHFLGVRFQHTFLATSREKSQIDLSHSKDVAEMQETEDDPEEDDDVEFQARARLAAQAAMRDSVSDDEQDMTENSSNRYSPFRNELNSSTSRHMRSGRLRLRREEAGQMQENINSTRELYEKARLAASARAPAKKAAPPTNNNRRPWTEEEEKALMHGLDRVKGPHWSQILVMYGADGTVSEILKGRSQVQLKDKARNLKLFFLKNGIRVPYYLQGVTGELKTRAPTRAAKHEARHELQQSGSMDKMTDEMIAALTRTSRAPAAASREPEGVHSRPHNPQKAYSSVERLPQEARISNAMTATRSDEEQRLTVQLAVQQAVGASKALETGAATEIMAEDNRVEMTRRNGQIV